MFILDIGSVFLEKKMELIDEFSFTKGDIGDSNDQKWF